MMLLQGYRSKACGPVSRQKSNFIFENTDAFNRKVLSLSLRCSLLSEVQCKAEERAERIINQKLTRSQQFDGSN
jgi:hypothetical protein